MALRRRSGRWLRYKLRMNEIDTSESNQRPRAIRAKGRVVTKGATRPVDPGASAAIGHRPLR